MTMNKNQTITLVALLLVIVGSGVYSQSIQQKSTNNTNNTQGGFVAPIEKEIKESSDAVCVLPNGEEIYDPSRCEEVKTYRSDKLGIEFQIVKSAEILEEGNKVYVTSISGANIKEGQSVEIITKSSLQTPLEKVIELSGPTYKYCQITLFPDHNYPNWQSSDGDKVAYPETYSIIGSHANEKDFDLVSEGKAPLCQSKYAGLNGMVMFLADSANPTKLAFFSIGQYSEPAGPYLDWFHTFRFIK